MNAEIQEIPAFDYKKRLAKVHTYMNEQKVDVLLLTNLQNIYWMTGTAQYGNVIIPKDKNPIVLIRRNFFRAQNECFWSDLREMQKTKEIANIIDTEIKLSSTGIIGTELNGLPASYYLRFNKILQGRICHDLGDAFTQLRAIKEEPEIELIKNSCAVAEEAQKIAKNMAKPGVSESEIAARMIETTRRLGSETYCLYRTFFAHNWLIVASGENIWTPSTFPVLAGGGTSPAIPYGPSHRRLREGDMLVCDYAVLVNGYHADHARTYLIGNKEPENFKQIYGQIMEIYSNLKDMIKPGVLMSELWNFMYSSFAKYKLEKYFQGDGKYYQGLGHGIGLELDEPPFILKNIDVPIEKNMVLSIEPKIIIPGWGGIQFEDDFLVTNKNALQLTNSPYIFKNN